MPKIIVREPFKFAHHGYEVQEFEASADPIDTTDECAEIAIREGWAVAPAAPAETAAPAAEQEPEQPKASGHQRRGKAHQAAPENK